MASPKHNKLQYFFCYDKMGCNDDGIDNHDLGKHCSEVHLVGKG